MYGKGYLILGNKNSFWGKKHTLETKNKISIAKKGKKNLLISIDENTKSTIIALSNKFCISHIKKYLIENNIIPKKSKEWSNEIIYRIVKTNPYSLSNRCKTIIYSLYDYGKNLQFIIDFLNNCEFYSRNGNIWNKYSVGAILQNRKKND
jgi:hypothetical protein